MTDTIKNIADEIKSWDKNDVHDLRAMISRLNDECKAEAERLDDFNTRPHDLFIQVIDLSDIPSCEFPSGFNTIECWAMDKKGFVLCGQDIDTIEHISELIED